jgi:hypothetical protein
MDRNCKEKRRALVTCSARSANAMDVSVDVSGDIEVDDRSNLGNVQTARYKQNNANYLFLRNTDRQRR